MREREPHPTFIRPAHRGEYYPRIFRGAEMVLTLDDEVVRTQAAVHCSLLLDELNAIFAVVTPIQENVNAFGPRIRQLLILACTEVEAAWTGVLLANAYQRKNFNTKDYVKLADPLQLDQYAISLLQYPQYSWFKPFAGWDAAQPTASLAWYAAYNRTKHDRERSLAEATLERCVCAVGASLAMACAQFGTEPFTVGGRFSQRVLQIDGPSFHFATEGYVPPGTGGHWRRIAYPLV